MTAVCRYCMKPVQVRADGKLARHHVSIPVSRRAVHTVGAGSVRRRCSGSERPAQTAGKGIA